MIEDCILCEAINISNKRIENTILYESERFVVIPTLGQFIPGWLMVVSKDHFRCAGVHSNDELLELSWLITKVRKVIEKSFGSSIVFEHGHGGSIFTSAGCCVEHTHIHISPCLNQGLYQLPNLEKIARSFKINEFQEVLEDCSGYLLISSEFEKDLYKLYPIKQPIPKQFLRKLLAVSVGKGSRWNWRIYPEYQNIYLTIQRVFEIIKNGVLK